MEKTKAQYWVFTNCMPDAYTGSGLVIQQVLSVLGPDIIRYDNPVTGKFLNILQPRLNSLRLSIGWLLLFARQKQKLSFNKILVMGGEAWLFLWVYRKWFIQKNIQIIHYTNGPEIRYRPHFKQEKWFNRLLTHWMRQAFTIPDKIITVSESDKDWLLQQQIVQNVHVLPPALDQVFDRPLPWQKEINANTNAPLQLLYCARWTQAKGKDIVLGILEYLTLQAIPFQLTLVGVGEETEVREELGKLDGTHITIYPLVRDKAELYAIYCAAQYLLFPSRGESFGLVPLEAMRCGCRVLATRVGILEQAHHDCFAPCDLNTESFIQALLSLRDNQSIGELMRENAFQFAGQFSFLNFQNRLEQLLGEG
ncbi:glycosyltransferase family 4 protein [Hydrotalea sp.]|uniref:glycosyltransferase family 4 protein n=1 Tax=Hydrotalea sp. TaxID=2881279 RepID=UPI003D132F84